MPTESIKKKALRALGRNGIQEETNPAFTLETSARAVRAASTLGKILKIADSYRFPTLEDTPESVVLPDAWGDPMLVTETEGIVTVTIPDDAMGQLSYAVSKDGVTNLQYLNISDVSPDAAFANDWRLQSYLDKQA